MPLGAANLKRELITFGLGIIVAGASWAFLDRLHWAARENELMMTMQNVDGLQKKMDLLPATYISRQEHLVLDQQSRLQHDETMTELRHLADRIDRLTTLTVKLERKE